ncbi:hypothetical protein LCGC14_2594860, partial [marine sediment metagenome]
VFLSGILTTPLDRLRNAAGLVVYRIFEKLEGTR